MAKRVGAVVLLIGEERLGLRLAVPDGDDVRDGVALVADVVEVAEAGGLPQVGIELGVGAIEYLVPPARLADRVPPDDAVQRVCSFPNTSPLPMRSRLARAITPRPPGEGKHPSPHARLCSVRPP